MTRDPTVIWVSFQFAEFHFAECRCFSNSPNFNSPNSKPPNSISPNSNSIVWVRVRDRVSVRLGSGIGFGDSGYGDLQFGDLKFGELKFGELNFGKMKFGEMKRNRRLKSPFLGTPANTRISFILPETRVPDLHEGCCGIGVSVFTLTQ